MIENFIKRSYYFSPELLDEWEKFHAPSKDYSPSAAAAFLIYMVLEPALREQLRKLAFQKDIKKARIEARKALRQNIIDAYMSGFVGIFSEEDRKILMERFLQTEKKR
jgi:alpha-amylase/alpha-mannosidase (GH57 family)